MSQHANQHPELYEDGDDPFDDFTLARHFDFPPAGTRPRRFYYLARGRVFGDLRKGNQ